MPLNASYRQILSISAPIMIGSAVQNVIALSDSVFLYHLSELDFASIGFVGVFYLVIAAIGFGFSKGGQIMIARRMGEERTEEVGKTFYAMLYFELGLALIMFLFMHFGCSYFFGLFVNSEEIITKSMEYLDYRSYGVFFSYAGVAMVALYTGIARTYFIIIDTIILAIVNIVLNYGLIFGNLGLPEMGIAGAGLASTLAEVVAFVIFIIYLVINKSSRRLNLFKLPNIDIALIRKQLEIASPIVFQAVVGIGSWFVFFGIIENLGERELAMTNLVRIVYLALSIPTWGFASGVNTMVSNFIGQGKRDSILPIANKTAKLCWLITMVITLPVVLFPEQILYPILGSEDMSLITDSQPILYVLLGILSLFSFGGVYFNALTGTGATYYGLKLQFVCSVFYLLYIYVIVNYIGGGLEWAWASEIFYWIAITLLSYYFLRSTKWHKLTV